MDEVREKIPSFQKVTHFLGYKIFIGDAINLGICLCEDVSDYRDRRRINLKRFVLIGLYGFATH